MKHEYNRNDEYSIQMTENWVTMESRGHSQTQAYTTRESGESLIEPISGVQQIDVYKLSVWNKIRQ